jgi:hypothetical protein
MADDNSEIPPARIGGFAEAMMAEGDDRKQRLEKAASDLQAEMEAAGEQIRALVVTQPVGSVEHLRNPSPCRATLILHDDATK